MQLLTNLSGFIFLFLQERHADLVCQGVRVKKEGCVGHRECRDRGLG